MIAERPVLTFNGINGATGGYLLPEISPGRLLDAVKGEALDQEHLYDLKLRLRQASGATRALKEGLDPLTLSQAGWGAIFAFDEQEQIPAIQEALAALLDLRKAQAGERYKEFICRPGESKTAFLARYGAGPGPADPNKVPYYLLIVASPEAIPYDFQYQLDVQYAVGRLHFDSLDDYAHYARGVVAMEGREAALPRQAAFFGVQNEDDQATQLSATQLVLPLSQALAADPAHASWEIRSLTGEEATKSALSEHLGGERTPALLFTASHGMGFPNGDPRQLPHQGALVCQDWPGPFTWREPIPEDHYFSADDLTDAPLNGGISFHYACYGAGTPQMDDFAHRLSGAPAAIAARAFVARLPQRLLSHAAGGLQAVVGHVERAWGYSFVWRNAGSQLAVFESAIKRLMAGYPVGYAMEYFNARYAELSTVISSEMLGAQFGKIVDEVELAGMWTANNDARSYVILGDPAVRLRLRPLAEMAAERPAPATVALGAAGPQASLEAIRAHIEALRPPAERRRALELVLDAMKANPQQPELLRLLGDLLANSPSGDRLQNLRIAISCYQGGSGASGTVDQPAGRVAIQPRLAEALCEQYAWTGERGDALQAEEALRLALASFQGQEDRPERSTLLRELAHLFARRSRLEKDLSLAHNAIETFQQALEITPRQEAAFEWGTIHQEIGSLEGELLTSQEDEQRRERAVSHLRAALEVFTAELFPDRHAEVGRRLAALEGDEGGDS